MWTDYSRRRISRRADIAITMLVGLFFLAMAVVCYGCAVGYLRDDCEQRGGHMEPVVGGRGGSVCVGATR